MDMSSMSGMTMSTTAAPSSTMTGMSHGSMTMSGGMASSTAMSGMDGMSGMDMSGGMMMSMKNMMMTFFTATNTPLYSEAWTPSNDGQYVGTCIFLIVLAAIFRGIIALRANFPALMVWWAHRRDTSLLRSDFEDDAKWGLVAVPQRPWNVNEALLRAILDTILAGVSYLL